MMQLKHALTATLALLSVTTTMAAMPSKTMMNLREDANAELHRLLSKGYASKGSSSYSDSDGKGKSRSDSDKEKCGDDSCFNKIQKITIFDAFLLLSKGELGVGPARNWELGFPDFLSQCEKLSVVEPSCPCKDDACDNTFEPHDYCVELLDIQLGQAELEGDFFGFDFDRVESALWGCVSWVNECCDYPKECCNDSCLGEVDRCNIYRDVFGFPGIPGRRNLGENEKNNAGADDEKKNAEAERKLGPNGDPGVDNDICEAVLIFGTNVCPCKGDSPQSAEDYCKHNAYLCYSECLDFVGKCCNDYPYYFSPLFADANL